LKISSNIEALSNSRYQFYQDNKGIVESGTLNKPKLIETT